MFEEIAEFPTSVVFWRPANETLTRHRNPVFDQHELGVTPSKSVVVELLHAVFLGVLLVWCRVAIWALIQSGAYGQALMTRESLLASILVLRNKLMQFYPRYEKGHQETLTPVVDLTPSMLGAANNPVLKTKGAETWGIALFLLEELRLFHAMLPDSRLLHAGQSIERVIRIWKGSSWVMPASLQKDLA